jgi:hypothetical protein
MNGVALSPKNRVRRIEYPVRRTKQQELGTQYQERGTGRQALRSK